MISRSSAADVSRVLHSLFPEKAFRERAEALLADSIREADTEGSSSWEITLKPNAIVFNVGQVALLWMKSNELEFYYRAPAGKRSFYSPRSIATPVSVDIITAGPRLALSARQIAAHRAAIRAAAQAKPNSPFKRAYSPGVVEYLRERGHRDLRHPAYHIPRSVAGRASASKAVGAGRGNSLTNPLVEKAAVECVETRFRALGFTVKSVERDGLGFDLLCTKQREIRWVEVKGVSGASPSFTMTRREVEVASTDARFVLAVVTNALRNDRKLHLWSSKEFRRDFAVSPSQYDVRLYRSGPGRPQKTPGSQVR